MSPTKNSSALGANHKKKMVTALAHLQGGEKTSH